jgi:hypothetical protein
MTNHAEADVTIPWRLSGLDQRSVPADFDAIDPQRRFAAN